jgi:hypothetical protein
MKKLIILLLLSIFNIACAQKPKVNSSEVEDQIEKERLSLKNAAFCTCLYKSFPSGDSIFVSDGSGAAYLELGAHSLDAYIKVMDAATARAKVRYESKTNKRLAVMNCLEFYNSRELDNLVRSLDSELNTGKLKDKSK